MVLADGAAEYRARGLPALQGERRETMMEREKGRCHKLAADADELVKAVRLAGPRALPEAEREAVAASPSPDEAMSARLVDMLASALKALRIDNGREIEAGNANLLMELRESVRLLIAKVRRGEEEFSVRYEFPVLGDGGDKRRTVVIDLAAAEMVIRVKGVEPRHGQDGMFREVGEYVKQGRPQEAADGSVNHFITGRFAPGREGEILVVIDNSLVRGENGVDCLGRAIKPREGIPCRIESGKGIRKKPLGGGRIQLIAGRTGVVVPVYNEEGVLCSLDVRESVKIGEVGHREGGHLAARGAGGGAAALDIGETTVDNVARGFVVHTSGTVNVRHTIFGEVQGGVINAEMVNAEGRLVAARDAIDVRRSVQATILHARVIRIGHGKKPGSIINATFRARHGLSVGHCRILGRNSVVLGNDLPALAGGGGAKGGEAGELVVSGEDIFVRRPELLARQQELRSQRQAVVREIRDGLVAQVKKQEGGGGAGKDFRKLLDAIAVADRTYGRCPADEEEQLAIRLVNSLMDLGVRDTLWYLNRFSAKKQLGLEVATVGELLAAISPPLAVKLDRVEMNDSAWLTIRCWDDELVVRRVDQELVVSREQPATELYRGPATLFSLTVTFDYETGQLSCAVHP